MKPKQERRCLRELYAQIPTFKCIEGCTDCCGPVAASREERRAHPEFMDLRTAHDVIEVLQSGMAGRLELQKAPRLADWAYGSGCLNALCSAALDHRRLGGVSQRRGRPRTCGSPQCAARPETTLSPHKEFLRHGGA